MGRVALATLVLAGATAPATLAAATPRWTAKGEVTQLNAHVITVQGKSCRITPASPARTTLRLYFVGAEAKIACADGVLRAIDVLKPLPAITGKPTPPAPPTSRGSPSPTLLTTQVSGTTVAEGLIGNIAVAALGDGSITVGAGTVTLTCGLGEASPDVGGLQVGDRLTRLECRNGVLTNLIRT